MKKNEIKEEEKKVKYLQILVDITMQVIATQELSYDEACERINKLRTVCTTCFPDKGETFDLIYRPRLLRHIHKVYKEGKQ
ncbi:hypothetical protein ACFL1T_01910 [Chlamydiota bacterium]